MFIGNSSVQKYYNKLVRSDTLSHAYLFHGPEGVGKRLFALEISKSIVGPYAGSDLKIIDSGDNEIHIGDIRDLKNFINLTPFGKHKAAVVNNAHKLGYDASNALLKILEEPPGRSIIFLISHLPKLLLPTVVSRCQPIRFKPLKEEEVFGYLVSRGGVKRDIAEKAAKLSRGSLGLAVSLADNFDSFQKNIGLLNKLVRAGFKERFDIAKKISSSTDDLKKAVENWLIWSASEVSDSSSAKLAKNLLYLDNVLSRPQFNHKLALEGFLVRL